MNTPKSLSPLYVMYAFLKRDLYVYIKRLRVYGVNYALINPINTVVAVGYLQTTSYFSTNYHSATELFAGNILLVITSLTFEFAFALLYDLEGNNHTSYQLLLLSPRLLLLEKIIFASFFSFILLTPFFPLCKLLLQHSFNTMNTIWIQVYLILFAAVLCGSAYHLFVACIIKSSRSITNFWIRINAPLELLGGFWAPLHILGSFSSILGILSFGNPFMYMTEGFRQAIIGGNNYLSLPLCLSVLFSFSILFTYGSIYAFKRKTDCV